MTTFPELNVLDAQISEMITVLEERLKPITIRVSADLEPLGRARDRDDLVGSCAEASS